MAAKLKWWIKERDNPQLGIYYVPEGQMTKAEAKQHEKSLYGYNYMLSFDTKEAYDAKLAELKAQGKKVM